MATHEQLHFVPQRAADHAPPPAPPSALHSLLAPDERIEWSGYPVAWRLALRKWPFAILGTLMLIVPVTMLRQIAGTNPLAGPVAPVLVLPIFVGIVVGGCLIVIVALTMLAQPLARAWVAAHTLYAITNRRVIIVNTSPLSRGIHEFRSGDIRRIVTFHARGGIGDVLLLRGPIDFASMVPNGSRGLQAALGDWRIDAGILAVPDPDHVEQLIRRLHLITDSSDIAPAANPAAAERRIGST